MFPNVLMFPGVFKGSPCFLMFPVFLNGPMECFLNAPMQCFLIPHARFLNVPLEFRNVFQSVNDPQRFFMFPGVSYCFPGVSLYSVVSLNVPWSFLKFPGVSFCSPCSISLYHHAVFP
jgi:hypothetical protein